MTFKELKWVFGYGYSLSCGKWVIFWLCKSRSKEGLQNCINATKHFSDHWHMTINLDKTKVLIFNKKGHKLEDTFTMGDQNITCTDTYTYLGIDFHNSGKFNHAIETLCLKSVKALHKVYKLLDTDIGISNILHIFDHTIKPILLYGSEIWAPFLISPKNIKCNKLLDNIDKNELSQIELKFYKRILQVRRNTTSIGVRG